VFDTFIEDLPAELFPDRPWGLGNNPKTAGWGGSDLRSYPERREDMTMNTESLKEAIQRELPAILRADPDFHAYVLELTRREYAGRAETQDRFYELLAELRRDREERAREWDEYKDEQNRKWEANQEELRRLHEEIMVQAKKYD